MAESKDTPKDNGGPAFPTIVSRDELMDSGYRTIAESENGMSLRDYFAAQAMTALLSHEHRLNDAYDVNDPEQARSLAYLSYQAADAMLAERR